MQATGKELAIARRFAAALDRCDYEEAGELLAADCHYYVSDNDVRIGPDAIFDSYRESDARARREFDQVRYTSAVASDNSGGVRLRFSDELHRNGQSHTFHCEQVVQFGANGRINRIELHELPEERERLNKFRESTQRAST